MNKHPLFKNVDISKYEKDFNIITYPENTLIFHEGESCYKLGIILKGQLIISTLTKMDKEYVINILNKDDLFGDTLLFNDNTTYLGDGITSKETRILYIKKEYLIKMFKDENFLLNFLAITSKKSMDLRDRLKLLSHNSIEERLLFYLSSKSKELNTNIIPIKSKESLAKILNIPRPSLSRELKKLKEKGILEYDKYSIALKIYK